MSKKILMFIAAVLLVGMSIPAFAAVENVKVGGDITIRGIHRTEYDFTKNSSQAQAAMDNVDYLMTTTRIYVTSELTDNVAVVVRLINERDWGADNLIADTFLFNVGGVDYFLREKRSGSNIDLDLAYIKLSDMFAPGLSATIGRQEILLGKGLVVGNANPWGTGKIRTYLDGPNPGTGNPMSVFEVETPIRAWDYNARKAFDAVRLDYALSVIPLTLTGALAKIAENYNCVIGPDRLGDTSLSVINANYQVPVADAEVEGYFINQSVSHTTKNLGNTNSVSTFGLRGSHNLAVVPGLSYQGELAFQSGRGTLGQFAGVDIKNTGSLMDAGVNYAFQNIAWLPKVGANYTAYSGDDRVADAKNKGWVVLYPDGLAEKVGAIAYRNNLIYAGAPTNAQIFKLSASVQPTEKLGVNLAWFNEKRQKSTAAADPGLSKDIGDEINLGLNYAYSEDVAMGLLIGYLQPGKAVKPLLNSTDAMQLVGTVAVSF